MSHGVNHLWLEGVRRFGLAGVPLRAHLLAGAGVVIPHVEAMVGAQSIGEYQWSNGVSALAAAGASVALADFLELFAEYRFSAARVRADLPNGALWTSLWTHHLAIGFSFASP
jgi:lipid A oxidase